MEQQGGRRGRPPHPDILTPAEWNVLGQLRKGLTNAEIAIELGISPDGVKYHVSNMLAKLGLPDRHALAQWEPPRPGLRRRFSPKAILAASLGFCGVAAVAAGIAIGVGASAGGVSGALASARVTHPVTSFELTATTYEDPARASVNSQPNTSSLDSTRHAWYRDGTLREEAVADGVSSNALTTGAAASLRTWQGDGGSGGIAALMSGSEVVLDLVNGQPAKWPVEPTSLAEVVAAVAPDGHAVFKGEGTAAGRDVYVVEVEPNCPSAIGAVIETLWIDKQTLFVLRDEQRSPDTLAITSAWEVTSIRYNTAIPDAVFAVPPDASTYTPNATGGGRIDYCTDDGCGSSGIVMMARPATTACETPAATPQATPTRIDPQKLLTVLPTLTGQRLPQPGQGR